MHPVAVIGLGNPLLSDEGIGVRVVEALRQDSRGPEHVDLLDLGTGGFRVLHELEGRSKVVFVDCALMNATPGTVRRFTPEEVVSRKVQTRLSLHEGDLLQTLELSRTLGKCAAEVVIFGIQPARVDWGPDLSPALEQRLSEYVALVRKEVEE